MLCSTLSYGISCSPVCSWNLSSRRVTVGAENVVMETSPRKTLPSLSRGWILEPGYEKSGGRIEVLLSEPDEVEDAAAAADIGVEQGFVDLNRKRSQTVGDMKLVTDAKYVRGADIEKKSFIRVYYISALRVPAEDSRELAESLREHLLHWPRVDNIARVLGDDVDEDLESLFLDTEKWSQPTGLGLRAAVYGEERSTNSESMTNGRSRQKPVEYQQGRNGIQTQPYTVENVERNNEVESNLSILGSLHKKWPGPTRLLLLDEELAMRSNSELPTAVQAVLSNTGDSSAKHSIELVSCRLTLYYDYWSLDEVLQDILPAEVEVPDSFERIGHVAFLGLSAQQFQFRHIIAQVTLDKHQPKVRSVVNRRESRYEKPYAVQVEVLAGTSSLVTTAWENGIPYRIDLGSVIWDPRLRADRQRLVKLFSRKDVVCDVFAGPGPVAITAGFRVRRTYANEVNPVAYQYLAFNVAENKVAAKVEIFNQDTRQFLSNIFHHERPTPITQVVMSYPTAAADLLDFFVGAFCRRTWPYTALPRFHIYGFSNSLDPESDFSMEIEHILGVLPSDLDVVLVAEVEPGEFMLRASFTLPAQVGFQQIRNDMS